MQHAAELHIVTLVAESSAPEWGCDSFWQGGDVNFESCAAVFGTFLKVGNESSQDALINSFLDYMPSTAGGVSQVSNTSAIDLNRFLPSHRSGFSYFGSLVRAGQQLLTGIMRWLAPVS